MVVLRVAVAFFSSATLFLAAQPVATVTSPAAFELQGHEVNVAGVPSWPVAAGDVVATHSSPATIQLREGVRVTLLEDSRVKIDSTSVSGITLELLAGRLRFGTTLPKQAKVLVDGKAAQLVSGATLASRLHPSPSAPPRNTGLRRPEFPTPVSSK